jgi:dTDP-4-amino-4,6-dideoxygalactose transaminase
MPESPDGIAPFRLQLVCGTRPERDELLGHLAAHGIYAPVHWRQDQTGLWSGDPEAAALSSRMLTLPVDHRCTPADLSRLAGVLDSPSPVRREPARH